eukprot:15432671-Alexandrium_andersonii.AAC.1
MGCGPRPARPRTQGTRCPSRVAWVQGRCASRRVIACLHSPHSGHRYRSYRRPGGPRLPALLLGVRRRRGATPPGPWVALLRDVVPAGAARTPLAAD